MVIKDSPYSDKKLYRGIVHTDGLPLLSKDIHENTDTLYKKNAFLTNNIIGNGILNTPTVEQVKGVSYDHIYVKLSEPAVLLIDGDISLIQFSSTATATSLDIIGKAEGVCYIVGWYQNIDATDTLKEYGGLINSTLSNDLASNQFKQQITTRYQFRWTTLLTSSQIEGENIFLDYNTAGDIKFSYHPDASSGHIKFSLTEDMIYRASKSSNINFTESDIYLIPLFYYKLKINPGTYVSTISYATMYPPVRPSSLLIKSNEEPTGSYKEGTTWFNPDTREFKTYVKDIGFVGQSLIESKTEPVGVYANGTTWFNPDTREFKTYVIGTGFVDSASKMGFLQSQSVTIMKEDHDTPEDITINIGIDKFTEEDNLQVYYEGVHLIEGTHYNITHAPDPKDSVITLLEFTANAGDTITFTAIKIVEANDITNITKLFLSHLNSKGSGSHVELSDSIDDSSSGVNKGIAATPKAVYESRIIHDQSNNTKYKFGVENGLLYIEEV